ncbi:LysR family transcriptional regulator [Streptomyces cucumeris]|uniref:LysR family transcriptional regulator n=1 Tax=Streptomyces cucumeris TaxID=2962890 RepID=UPI003D717761
MDPVGACRAFVSVSERGSFTVGAAAARMSQPVASRRIAALEAHLGEPLFERTSRRAVLTPFGRELLPAARQLVQAADVLRHEAEAANRKPWRLAMPGICSTVDLARLVADARGHGITLDLRVAPPDVRAELVRSQQVRAALLPVPPDEALWSVPLGLAGSGDPGARRVYLETLRMGRGAPEPPRRIRIQPEDDVPHIRDPLTRLRDAVGLRPAQPGPVLSVFVGPRRLAPHLAALSGSSEYARYPRTRTTLRRASYRTRRRGLIHEDRQDRA